MVLIQGSLFREAEPSIEAQWLYIKLFCQICYIDAQFWCLPLFFYVSASCNTPLYHKVNSETEAQSVRDIWVFPKRLVEPVEVANLIINIFENPVLNGEVVRVDGAARLPAKELWATVMVM